MRTTILYLAGALWEYTVALASHLSSLPHVCTNFQVHTGMDVFFILMLTVKASRKESRREEEEEGREQGYLQRGMVK